MSHLCLGSVKGSHLIINEEKYQVLLDKHPHTNDGYIHVVGGIVQNDEGKIYLHHHARLNEFFLPGGKVDHGETHEQALIRELSEELEIIVNAYHHLSSIKYIHGGVKRCVHMFVVDDYTGIPRNNEHKEYDHYRAEIIHADNSLGYAVKVDGTITDDMQDIMHSFIDIYHRKTVSPYRNSDLACRAFYRSYDPTQINLHQHYYMYFDDEKQEYYVDRI